MKGNDSKAPVEPVGIVISGFPRVPQSTVFSAYVWGPAPKTTEDKGPSAA
jgi:hypothetical protein